MNVYQRTAFSLTYVFHASANKQGNKDVILPYNASSFYAYNFLEEEYSEDVCLAIPELSPFYERLSAQNDFKAKLYQSISDFGICPSHDSVIGVDGDNGDTWMEE